MGKRQELREDIVKRLVVDTAIDAEIIEKVITHQFNSAYDAMRKNQSVEISGFGKFVTHDDKLKGVYNYFMQKVIDSEEKLKMEVNPGKRERLINKMEIYRNRAENIQKKKNGN